MPLSNSALQVMMSKFCFVFVWIVKNITYEIKEIKYEKTIATFKEIKYNYPNRCYGI